MNKRTIFIKEFKKDQIPNGGTGDIWFKKDKEFSSGTLYIYMKGEFSKGWYELEWLTQEELEEKYLREMEVIR